MMLSGPLDVLSIRSDLDPIQIPGKIENSMKVHSWPWAFEPGVTTVGVCAKDTYSDVVPYSTTQHAFLCSSATPPRPWEGTTWVSSYYYMYTWRGLSLSYCHHQRPPSSTFPEPSLQYYSVHNPPAATIAGDPLHPQLKFWGGPFEMPSTQLVLLVHYTTL